MQQLETQQIQPSANSNVAKTGIDRKNLKIIKQRFQQVNAARLQRTKSALGGRQEVFLELLPLLFHVNHPILPGYVSLQTPCGVTSYTPNREDVKRAQRWARSFTYRPQLSKTNSITGIFLMGSCGTIAQSGSSDLDIWICTETLATEEQLLLRQKCDAITRWADSIGQEAHFFLMEPEKFRQGERENLSTEDCGSSQHYLLLDEFYRTSLLIAGRMPIWWLVPPDADIDYDQYANNLRDKRYIRADDTLDFGNVDKIPAGEFVGAGVWQLYKAIDSPYKSVLKILLTEVYAAEYPEVELLSISMKQAIYNDELDIDELDPYVMVYRKLENYLLARNEHKRLELIRRCFYFKVGKLLTRPSRFSNKSWQRRLTEKLVGEWQWLHEHLLNLDSRKSWKVKRVVSEQKELVRELTNSYRFVLDFARRTQATAMINSKEMTILGRKLYAAFERKAGKIEWINPGITPDLSEENLTFVQVHQDDEDKKMQWAVTSDSTYKFQRNRSKPLKQSDSLVSLITWCHFNGIIDNSTRIGLSKINNTYDIEDEKNITDSELHGLVRSLQRNLPVARQYSDLSDDQHEKFAQGMRPTQIQLFINVGTDPLAHIHERGIERLSHQTDSLGYSGLRENLVHNVEQITLNSWGELRSQQYSGDNALVRCLNDYLQLLPPDSSTPLPQINVHCFCPSRAAAISHRVEELFRDIVACYYSGTRPAESRYILEIERDYFVLQFIGNQPGIEHVGGHSSLLKHLSHNQASFSPIVLDRYCLQNSALEAIAELNISGKIQVFYQCHDNDADVYLIDEMGSLYTFSTPFQNEASLLSPLDQFIQSTLFRQSSETLSSSQGHDNFDLNTREVEYYALKEHRNKFSAERRNIIDTIKGNHFFNVQAIGTRDMSGEIQFSIFCDQQEFNIDELGDELFTATAKFILGRRQSDERYPCYITDLDLTDCITSHQGVIQTIHYLRQKQKLEKLLNAALLTL